MKNYKPPKPIVTLLTISTLSLVAFWYFFFYLGDVRSRTCAVIVFPILIGYGLYAYFREKKADSTAVQKQPEMQSGDYFRSPEWREAYFRYKAEHPFEQPVLRSMRSDLLRRYRRSESLLLMVLGGFFLLMLINAMIEQFSFLYLLGIPVFGWMFVSSLKDFIGWPVRKWLKQDIDYFALEQSYQSGNMLTYESNGINLGSTHIIAYTARKVYAIDYRLAESISRKIVRLKKYEDSLYAGEEYQHFAVIHVRLPESQKITEIAIELHEFQVEMILEEFARRKPAAPVQNVFTEINDNDVSASYL